MPRWSRHSTPEALKDREQRQTDCRTHTHAHKGHNQKRNHTQTRAHTHTRHKWTPQSDAANPAAAGGGGFRCLQAGEWQHKDRRLPGCRQVWSIIMLPSLLSFLPSFPQSASLFYLSLLDRAHLPLPSSLNSETHAHIYPISPLFNVIHSSHTFSAGSFCFLSPTCAQTNLPPQRAQAPFTQWSWLEVILLTEISRHWALKTKWK